jgi:raffinose/stachyose/melibiose transport system permease protein
MKRVTAGRLIYWFLAVLWLVMAAFPLYFTVISSVKEDSEIFSSYFFPTLLPKLENFVTANAMSGIVRAIVNSILLSFCSVAVMLILVIPLAFVVAREKIKYTNAVSLYFMAALMVPIQCAIVPIVQGVNLIRGQNNPGVLVLLYAGINMPMTFFIMSGTFSEINTELDESAAIDGCGLLQIIFRIIVPIAKPGISTCMIVAFLSVYNELALANVLISKKQYRTISVALLNFKGDFGTYYSIIFAAILLCMIPTVLFYLLAQEKVEKGISTGALKG